MAPSIDRGDTYDRRLMRIELRCAAPEYRVSNLAETRGGVTVDSGSVAGEWTPVSEGSAVENLVEALCDD